MNRLLSELRRRNVFRVAAAYLVAAWLVMQVIAVISDAAGMPDWADSLALILLIAGLPVVLFIAWAFELTPDGLKPTDSVAEDESQTAATRSKLDLAIIGGLAVVAILMLGTWLWPRDAGDPADPVSPQELVADAAEPAAEQAADQATASASEVEGPSGQSVAVLPFLALSSDEEDRYFADGLTEEILNYLAAVPELMVTSRTSAFQYRGDDLPSVPEIARQLGVAHIVEGTVRRAGDRVRITAQLIRAEDDTHLWSQTYDRTMDDAFAVQDDIAQNITTVLDIVLDAEEVERMRARGLQSVDAYIAYQRGNEIFQYAHFEAPDLIEALEPAMDYFSQATELAPGFTDAYLGQADYFAHLMRRSAGLPGELAQTAYREASAQYFGLINDAWMSTTDPNRRAMISIDRVYMSESWAGADQIVDAAASVAGCPESFWVRELVALSGRAADFIPYAEQRTRCDPLNFANWHALAGIAYDAGDFDRAFRAASQAMTLDGNADAAALLAANALMQAGRNEEIRQYMDLMQVDPFARFLMEFMIAARAGDRETAENLHAQMMFPEGMGLEGLQIVLHAMIGQHDAATVLAADLDGRALGNQLLMSVVMDCRCGAPWDIAQTPNFARRIEEAGYPWPPAGGENFPLNEG